MIDSQVFLSLPLKFNEQISIYPPLVKDVVATQYFGSYVKLLTITKEEIEDEILKDEVVNQLPDPFEYLFVVAKASKKYEVLIQKAFEFFIHEKVNLVMDKMIIIVGDLENILTKVDNVDEIPIIRHNDYFSFQNKIRESLGMKIVEKENDDQDVDPRIKRMKMLARKRDKVKAKSKESINFSSYMSSLCCMGIGINPLNIGELSYATVYDLVRRFQEKEKYEIEIRSLQAGASSKKIHPKYWIRNIDD